MKSTFVFLCLVVGGMTQSTLNPSDHVRGQISAAGDRVGAGLVDFGENNAQNINGAGRIAHETWMNFHQSVDDHLDNGHEALKDFGRTTSRILERIPILGDQVKGHWDRFQTAIDSTIDRTKGHLKNFGNDVARNVNAGTRQFGRAWESTREVVDSNLGAGLGAVRGQQGPQQPSVGVTVPSVSALPPLPRLPSVSAPPALPSLPLPVTEAPEASVDLTI